MVSIRSLATALASVALLVPFSIAHSVDRNPLSYISLLDEPDIRLPSKRVHSHSRFDLTFSIHQGAQEVRLVLEPNTDVIPNSFSVTTIGTDGKPKSIKSVDRTQHKVFRGKAFVRRQGLNGWHEAGWARIMMHRDGKTPLFDGTFRLDGDLHQIQRGPQYRRTRLQYDPELEDSDENVMVVWRNSDIMPFNPADDEEAHLELKRAVNDAASCAADSLEFNRRDDDLEYRNLASIDSRDLLGRQTDDGDAGGDGRGARLIDSIGSTDGCPSTRKVALVGIATDCNYWGEFDGEEDLRRHVIGLVNQASEVYESTFNISLGIANLTIIDSECPSSAQDSAPWNVACGGNVDISDRLNRFSEWRGRFEDNNAYWTLLTTCASDSAVGLAWRRQLCRRGAASAGQNNETVAATNVVVKKSSEWQIFAHETGHTFGAFHDCTERECPVGQNSQQCCPLSTSSCNAGGDFLMNPSTSDSHNRFSPCSIGNICTTLRLDTEADCLTDNRNVDTIMGSQCGNGIVESGEDCDCGGTDSCGENSCCDAATCKFRGNAQCDPSNEDCCTDSCRFASSGTVCRPSSGDCDPEETCPGDAARCPTDEHADDGEDCGDGLQCASGQCTSRDQQCRNVVGETVASNNTSACDEDQFLCRVICTAPERGGNTCVMYNQNYLDGTPCGSGGRCQDGTCEGNSTLNQIGSWFDRNQNIWIPIAAVLGALLAIAILSCMFSSCRKRRRAAARAKAAPPPRPRPEMNNWQAFNGHYGNSPPAHHGNGAAHPGFQPPPPAYGQGMNNGVHSNMQSHMYEQPPPQQFGRWNRTRSMRYA